MPKRIDRDFCCCRAWPSTTKEAPASIPHGGAPAATAGQLHLRMHTRPRPGARGGQAQRKSARPRVPEDLARRRTARAAEAPHGPRRAAASPPVAAGQLHLRMRHTWARSSGRGGQARREEDRAAGGGGAGTVPNGTPAARYAVGALPAAADQLKPRMQHTRRARADAAALRRKERRAADAGNAARRRTARGTAQPTTPAHATDAGALGRRGYAQRGEGRPGRRRRRRWRGAGRQAPSAPPAAALADCPRECDRRGRQPTFSLAIRTISASTAALIRGRPRYEWLCDSSNLRATAAGTKSEWSRVWRHRFDHTGIQMAQGALMIDLPATNGTLGMVSGFLESSEPTTPG
jgi:hypothetical protein